jgi:hypothetical protein
VSFGRAEQHAGSDGPANEGKRRLGVFLVSPAFCASAKRVATTSRKAYAIGCQQGSVIGAKDLRTNNANALPSARIARKKQKVEVEVSNQGSSLVVLARQE